MKLFKVNLEETKEQTYYVLAIYEYEAENIANELFEDEPPSYNDYTREIKSSLELNKYNLKEQVIDEDGDKIGLTVEEVLDAFKNNIDLSEYDKEALIQRKKEKEYMEKHIANIFEEVVWKRF